MTKQNVVTLLLIFVAIVAVIDGYVIYRHDHPIKKPKIALRIDNPVRFTNGIHTFEAEARPHFECLVYKSHESWYLDHRITNLVNQNVDGINIKIYSIPGAPDCD